MNLRKIFFGAWIFLATGWIAYLCLGAHLAHVLAARFGDKIQRGTQGKVADIAVPVFIQNRIFEALWLATLALFFCMAHWLFEKWRGRRNIFARSRWAIHGLAGFIFFNIWIGAAANTALFWGLLGAGAGFQNLMQFEIKRIIMNEYPGRHQAVLLGNSQTAAQMDEGQLNDMLGNRIWTTEIQWPGSQAFDLLVVERQIRKANPELVICYVTEGYFYLETKGESISPFFSFRDVPYFIQRGAFHQLPDEKLFYGILGDVMPLFRCRDMLAQRVLGDATVNLKQVEYDSGLTNDLPARAKATVVIYKNDRSSDFQKQAFEDFIGRCQKANRRVILFVGQSNPLLERELDPSFHSDMSAFLNQVAVRHSNVILVSANEMPVETAADYKDLSHVNLETQKRFTAWLGDWLEKRPGKDLVPEKK